MSETAEPLIEEPVAPAPEPVVDTPVDQPTDQQVTDPADPEPTTEPAPKSKSSDRRFANLSARNTTLERQLADEHTARLAAEALLAARQEGSDDPAPKPSSETVEQAAARLVAQRDFDSKRRTIITNGAKEFGDADWNEKTDTLTALGAVSNPHFMDALVDIPNAPQLIAALVEDTDALINLLNRTPVSMAAEMGRMAAKIETQAATPAKPLSRAPNPVLPVQRAAVVPAVDPYRIKTIEDWKAYREKTAPKRLGGRA